LSHKSRRAMLTILVRTKLVDGCPCRTHGSRLVESQYKKPAIPWPRASSPSTLFHGADASEVRQPAKCMLSCAGALDSVHYSIWCAEDGVVSHSNILSSSLYDHIDLQELQSVKHLASQIAFRGWRELVGKSAAFTDSHHFAGGGPPAPHKPGILGFFLFVICAGFPPHHFPTWVPSKCKQVVRNHQ